MGLKQDLEQKFQQLASRVATLGPHPQYLNELGGVLFELGMFDEAKKMFEAALRKDRTFEVARNNLNAINKKIAKQVKPGAIQDLIRRLAPVRPARPLVRIGSAGDGGYLAPDDLNGIAHCFSPGVGPTSRFEAALEDYGIHSFLADASVEGPASTLNSFTFDKLFLGEDGQPDQISLASWVTRYIPDDDDRDLLLQMDIEGAEFPVIEAAPPDLLRRFRIMIVEFHGLQRLGSCDEFGRISSVLDKILEDFHVVHLHPNNCCGSEIIAGIEIPRVLEFTFLRKDRDDGGTFVAQLPHPLDADCVPSRPTLVLDPAFLRGS
jgi:hypothetical protein